MQETSSYMELEQKLSQFKSLRGLTISVQPDGLLFDAYFPQAGWEAEDIASALGDFVEGNKSLLRAFRCSTSNLITIETDNGTVVLREIGDRFVVGMLFSEDLPLGLLRTFAEHIGEQLFAELSNAQIAAPQESTSNAVRVLNYLTQYAPDPHTSLMRIALKTGIPITILNQPQHLTHEQTAKIETAVCDVLGIDELVL